MATPRRRIEIPLNRVEGDLEIRIEIEDGVVVDAWSVGTMYRGIEAMLKGRAARDGLVITPRVCGICGTAHLNAAVGALEAIAGVTPPPNALRVRHVALMTEQLQSDLRQSFLMFAPDVANPAYRPYPWAEEAYRRYAPLRGSAGIEVIRETKRILEIIAILGGQWPHSSYMVPGGVTTIASLSDMTQCEYLLGSFRDWYERTVLGCSLERWQEVRTAAELDGWLDENERHKTGELGFLIRIMRDLGLEDLGRGPGQYLSFGLSAASAEHGRPGGLVEAGGFARGTRVDPLDQQKITEHVAHSWYVDYEGGRHPHQGLTEPCAKAEDGIKYSWAKAPRYEGAPAETGPLAELMVAGDPLIQDLYCRRGPSAFLRQFARLTRPARRMPVMARWLAEIETNEPFYASVGGIPDGRGVGCVQAARGALGHWVQILDGKIQRYQIITPTAWNGSPRDANGIPGPWEQALQGLPVADSDNPVEVGHVVRSFDPCLVCTVHAVHPDGRDTRCTL